LSNNIRFSTSWHLAPRNPEQAHPWSPCCYWVDDASRRSPAQPLRTCSLIVVSLTAPTRLRFLSSCRRHECLRGAIWRSRHPASPSRNRAGSRFGVQSRNSTLEICYFRISFDKLLRDHIWVARSLFSNITTCLLVLQAQPALNLPLPLLQESWPLSPLTSRRTLS
jgi:hypothetical protein